MTSYKEIEIMENTWV